MSGSNSKFKPAGLFVLVPLIIGIAIGFVGNSFTGLAAGESTAQGCGGPQAGELAQTEDQLRFARAQKSRTTRTTNSNTNNRATPTATNNQADSRNPSPGNRSAGDSPQHANDSARSGSGDHATEGKFLECHSAAVTPDGFAGVKTLKCDPAAKCVGHPGMPLLRYCKCDAGYVGDGKTCCPIGSELNPYWPYVKEKKCRCANGSWAFKSNPPARSTRDPNTGLWSVCVDIDECQEQTNNCGNGATCVDTLFGYNCDCGEGAAWDGKSCKAVPTCQDKGNYTQGKWDSANQRWICHDVDECQTNQHNCTDPNVPCYNVYGGFLCDCGEGAAWDGVNCVSVECPAGAAKEGNKCVCAPGYEISLSAIDDQYWTGKGCIWDWQQSWICLCEPKRCGSLVYVGGKWASLTNQRVENNECVNCPDNTFALAPQYPIGNDTSCDISFPNCIEKSSSYYCSCNKGDLWDGAQCTKAKCPPNVDCSTSTPTCVEGYEPFKIPEHPVNQPPDEPCAWHAAQGWKCGCQPKN